MLLVYGAVHCSSDVLEAGCLRNCSAQQFNTIAHKCLPAVSLALSPVGRLARTRPAASGTRHPRAGPCLHPSAGSSHALRCLWLAFSSSVPSTGSEAHSLQPCLRMYSCKSRS